MVVVQKQKIELVSGTLSLAFTVQGEGRTFVVLHGGAGPASVSGLVEELSQTARVVVPTLPGFNGESRPESFTSIADVAAAYSELLDRLDLSEVVVVGNSVGGWIAAEMALLSSPRIAGMVLLNAVGIDTGSPDKKIVDPMAVAPAERSALSFHNPQKFGFAPPSPEALAVMTENQKTLRVYAGEPFMHDPTLRSRLTRMATPTLVVWGTSDHIVDADYGRRWAQSIPGARFEPVAEAGHFPQVERLDAVVELLKRFTSDEL